MTTAGEERRAPAIRQILSLSSLWFILRSPKMFTASLLVMGAVFAIAAMIPQQPANFATPGDFVVWFWLPLAWLTLVSLIILADYGPAAWQRLWKQESLATAPLPNPLSHYRRKTIRLTAPRSASESTASDVHLAELRDKLTAGGYQIHPVPTEQTILASRHSWRWSGPVLLVLSILALVMGSVFQALWGQSEEILLSTQTTSGMTFINQTVTLNDFTPVSDRSGRLIGGSISLDLGDRQDLDWRLYRPYRLGGWWIIPAKTSAVAEVTFTQQQTVEKVDLIFDDVAKPLYFFHSPANLTFELRYVAAPDAPDYHLNIIKATQPLTGQIKVARQGNTFSIPGVDLQGHISIEDKLFLRAYKIPGLLPFVAGGLFFLLGMLQFPLRPPGIVRLEAIKKGRGSRIVVEVEMLGDSPHLDEMIEHTLVLNSEERTND